MRTTTLRDYQARMLRVREHLERHLDEEIDLASLARVACFSPFHFHRIFSGMVGESVKAHVRRLRLERAAGRLKRGTSSVTALAFDAGFQSLEAFTRAFKALFGVSPAAYRRRKRPAAAPPRRMSEPLRVDLLRLPPARVAFVRHVGPYSTVGAAWDRLLTRLGREGRLGAGSRFLGVCFDDPDVTPAARIRYEACVTVDADFRPDGEIGLRAIPGGDYARATHAGPYAKLCESYRWLIGDWLPRSGRELRDLPCFEAYLSDPESTAPRDLLTDLHVPLKGRP